MTAVHSRLTADSQTTLPSPVRIALGLKPGDLLEYDIEDSRVVLRRSPPTDAAHLRALQATLSEWDTPDDAAAFDDL